MKKIELTQINTEIADWLGWVKVSNVFDFDYYESNAEIHRNLLIKSSFKINELKFDTDSNWQWLCLKKIMELEDCSIDNAFQLLSITVDINTKLDLFAAIYNYIKNGIYEN